MNTQLLVIFISAVAFNAALGVPLDTQDAAVMVESSQLAVESPSGTGSVSMVAASSKDGEEIRAERQYYGGGYPGGYNNYNGGGGYPGYYGNNNYGSANAQASAVASANANGFRQGRQYYGGYPGSYNPGYNSNFGNAQASAVASASANANGFRHGRQYYGGGGYPGYGGGYPGYGSGSSHASAQASASASSGGFGMYGK